MEGEEGKQRQYTGSENPSERFSKLFLSYLAGFFDGEGWISIRKNNTVIVGLAQKDPSILNSCQECFKGRIYIRDRSQNQWRPKSIYYEWILEDQRSLFFLLSISPFLILKKEKALKAIQLLQFKRIHKYQRRKVND